MTRRLAMKKRTLHNKKIVITGAASGIGRDLAAIFAQKGCTILIADVNDPGSRQTLDLVRNSGGDGEIFHCDVSKLDDVMKMADHCYEKWGTVDILINNAGVAAAGFMGDIPIEDWEWIVAINFWGVVHGCHAFVPRMKKQGDGYIVNVASAAGIISFPEMSSYNSTKAAVISISETLKCELAPHGIGVTVLCPTFINTNLFESLRCTDDFQRMCTRTGFENARVTSRAVAEKTVKAIENNKLYVLPQAGAKLSWIYKRMAPSVYYGSLAFLMRIGLGRKFMLTMSRIGF
jgi:NAD(P)-dependent dehydrogenase (short-subunit alcohol dehydrogenase family)